MTGKFGCIIEWLKQPSTLKGIVVLVGMAGFAVDSSKIQEIILAASGLYAAIGMFYDNTARTPKVPTAEELNNLLSSEEIVALVKLRKARIAASKEVLGEK
jgi:hypothetical protein